MIRDSFAMFIDLHCHILHGIDDGPEQPEEALAMARALVAAGFGTVAASPHARPEFPGPEDVARRCGETAALLAQQRIPLELRLSAENLFDAEFLERELEGRGRHIHHSRYVLVETPYQSGVPALPDLLFRLRRKGIVPVFAHPERCVEFEPAGRAEAAVQMGALLQLDLGSLLGRYGRGPRKEAKRLLDAGLYALAATDLHQASDAESWLGEAIQVLEKMAGRQSVTRMLEEVPARILRNEELV